MTSARNKHPHIKFPTDSVFKHHSGTKNFIHTARGLDLVVSLTPAVHKESAVSFVLHFRSTMIARRHSFAADMIRTNVLSEAVEKRADLPCGYEEDFVNPVDDDLQCSICQLTLRNPVLTRCGHRFCRGCLERHMSNR